MPSACAAMPMRPPSSVFIARAKPLPCLPSRRSRGMTQFSNTSSQVLEPRMPIFFSRLPTEKPGSVRSTRKAEISLPERPRRSGTVPVTAMTTKRSAAPAFVMKIFEPFRTQFSPPSSSTATVCCPCASVPAPDSVIAKAPSHSPEQSRGRYFAFCSGVPFSKIGAQQRLVCAERMTPVVAQTRLSSSTART